MKELVQHILAYLILVSALRGLVANPKYGQYLQFFSGAILVLLLLSPLLGFFDKSNTWYRSLEKNMLQMDLSDIESQMQIADEQFAEIVKKQYAATVRKQVIALAKEEGITLSEVTVTMQEKDACSVEKIEAKTAAEDAADEESQISVETIQIGDSASETQKKQDGSKQAKSLKKQISQCFAIGEDSVYLWK